MISEKIYKTDIIKVNYENGGEVQKIVNDWVSNKTDGKIQNMLGSQPDPFTKIIMVSALYFAGKWELPFIQQLTKRSSLLFLVKKYIFNVILNTIKLI